MKSGKSFSSRKSGGAGRGRSGGAKKSFGKKTSGGGKFSTSRGASKPYSKRDDRDEKPFGKKTSGGGKFSTSRGASKPYSKRDDRDEKPFHERSSSFQRSDEKNDFKKPYGKKFTSGAKPFGKRVERDERPTRERSSSFERSDERRDFKKPFDKKFTPERKPFGKRDNDRDDRSSSRQSSSYERSEERRDFKKPVDKKTPSRSKPFGKRDASNDRPTRERSSSFDRSEVRKDFKKPFDKKFASRPKPFGKRDERDQPPSRDLSETFRPTADGKDFVKRSNDGSDRPKRRRKDEEIKHLNNEAGYLDSSDENKWNRKSGHEFYGDKKKSFGRSRNDKQERTEYKSADDGSIRLNKYISNSGICSRREADELITAGVISVNGEIMTELGYKVKPGDEVKYNNETLKTEKLVYILLNKPKDFITTVDDPQDRKTVMWLIKDVCKERVYPVGRLDRNTTGVLLFTNDGELAKKLTHPSFGVQKIYQVELDSALKPSDMEEIANGLTLEDGYIKVDDIAYAAGGQDKSIIGVEIHSGKNRIVRRIFEHFGYYIKKLDRVYFAGLSKKDLPRGRSRFLTPIEVSNLKMMTGDKKMQKYYEA